MEILYPDEIQNIKHTPNLPNIGENPIQKK